MRMQARMREYEEGDSSVTVMEEVMTYSATLVEVHTQKKATDLVFEVFFCRDGATESAGK